MEPFQSLLPSHLNGRSYSNNRTKYTISIPISSIICAFNCHFRPHGWHFGRRFLPKAIQMPIFWNTFACAKSTWKHPKEGFLNDFCLLLKPIFTCFWNILALESLPRSLQRNVSYWYTALYRKFKKQLFQFQLFQLIILRFHFSPLYITTYISINYIINREFGYLIF